MSKKMKVLVSVLVAILVLTVGGTAIALAQEEEEPAPPVEANGLLARVAELLAIPEEDLIDAFNQARQELRQERWEETSNQALDKAVEEGLLTPEEADEIRGWWEQKPEALDRGLLQRACGFWSQRDGQMSGVRRGMRPEIGQCLAQRFLERARDRACIAQDETDEIGQWQNGGPEALNRLSPRARIFNAMRGRQMMAVPRGWDGQLPPELAD